MKVDLHIHTTASDGRLSPTGIITAAMEAGLSHIAITDHDTVDGLLELKNSGVTVPSTLSVIAGIELSSDLPEWEVHILGYNIDIHNQKLQNQLQLLIAHRHERTQQMIHKLHDLGYFITYQQVVKLAEKATAIGRPHIGKALVEQGYFLTVSEAFTQLIGKNGPAYVPHYKLTPSQVIALITEANGIPVLAHPGLIKNDEIVMDMILFGIQGLEVYHPTHSEEEIKKYLTMANNHKLLITGGSDFHGISGRFPETLGVFTLPTTLAYQLEGSIIHK